MTKGLFFPPFFFVLRRLRIFVPSQTFSKREHSGVPGAHELMSALLSLLLVLLSLLLSALLSMCVKRL